MPCRLITLALLAASAYAQPAFEVATIKPSTPSSPQLSIKKLPGGRLEVSSASLRFLVKWAFDLDDDRLAGGPKWFDDDHFDIVAKAPEENPAPGRMQLMMRGLLAQRFSMGFHHETRELTAYSLVIDRGTPRVHVVDATGGPGANPFNMTDGGRLVGTRVTATMLAKVLSEQLKRPVVNASGFTDSFDFTLEWSPDTDATSTRPSIFTAVKEQLGFRLESKKSSVEVLVIDRIERTPSAN